VDGRSCGAGCSRPQLLGVKRALLATRGRVAGERRGRQGWSAADRLPRRGDGAPRRGSRGRTSSPRRAWARSTGTTRRSSAPGSRSATTPGLRRWRLSSRSCRLGRRSSSSPRWRRTVTWRARTTACPWTRRSLRSLPPSAPGRALRPPPCRRDLDPGQRLTRDHSPRSWLTPRGVANSRRTGRQSTPEPL
jgi:hypothetical protein